jgi:glycosyltransferase A (GT-A) superfamily protein (DUF2064 family)
MTAPTVLVVAKSPNPGEAKTRLAAVVGEEAAAELAAAALLDTLDIVVGAAGSLGSRPLLALTGDLRRAARRSELQQSLRRCVVVPQRGIGLADRLANAHADAGRMHTGHGTLQVGMDTPQATVGDLLDAVRLLLDRGAVLGPAEDGGWWLLGLSHPAAAAALRGVRMSRTDTARRTVAALTTVGMPVRTTATLRDVDTADDARAVAAAAPHTRFATAFDTVRAPVAS